MATQDETKQGGQGGLGEQTAKLHLETGHEVGVGASLGSLCPCLRDARMELHSCPPGASLTKGQLQPRVATQL